MHAQLIPIIVPVLIAALIGYGWARLKFPFDRDFVTRVIMNIGAPCLVLNGIANLELQAAAFGTSLIAAITMLVTCSLLATVILRIAGQPLRSFLPPVVFGNTGNLGLPLCLFAFGPEGLGLAVAVYLVYSVTQFVFGPLFQGREPAWRTLATTPMIYAAIIGVLLLATGTPMPKTVANTVQLLGGSAIPLMLLALGHSLASFTVSRPGKAVGPGGPAPRAGFLHRRRRQRGARTRGHPARRHHHRELDAGRRIQLPAGRQVRQAPAGRRRRDPGLYAVVVPDAARAAVVRLGLVARTSPATPYLPVD